MPDREKGRIDPVRRKGIPRSPKLLSRLPCACAAGRGSVFALPECMTALATSVGRLQRLLPPRYRARARRAYYLALPAANRRSAMAYGFRGQARRCRDLGSPRYADLLERAACDIEANGPCWEALTGYAPDPESPADLAALRFMAAVHRLVLEGRAPDLASHYADLTTAAETTWRAFRDVVVTGRDAIRARLRDAVQTNEVGRCRALLGGFLEIARTTERPLRLVELGGSAGLNLRWDHYRYETPLATWGPATSPLRFAFDVADGHPPFEVGARVVERIGCDMDPIDPASSEGRLNLLSHVWADRPERLGMLRAAFDVAHRVPVRVEQGDASEWLGRELAQPAAGVATVVFHSAFSLYLGRRAWGRLTTTIEDAGRRATDAAPVAWLRLEQLGPSYALRLVTWPERRERVLATADAHGGNIRWLAKPTTGC